jgi:hypothetical protein
MRARHPVRRHAFAHARSRAAVLTAMRGRTAANATVGVIQETNAEKSIEALRRGEAHNSAVIRDGGHVRTGDAAPNARDGGGVAERLRAPSGSARLGARAGRHGDDQRRRQGTLRAGVHHTPDGRVAMQVPADCRLVRIDSATFSVDEALLTVSRTLRVATAACAAQPARPRRAKATLRPSTRTPSRARKACRRRARRA